MKRIFLQLNQSFLLQFKLIIGSFLSGIVFQYLVERLTIFELY